MRPFLNQPLLTHSAAQLRKNPTLGAHAPSASAPFRCSHKPLTSSLWLVSPTHYNQASEILNRLVFAQPKNRAAKNLLADVFEQIGYQNATLTNIKGEQAKEPDITITLNRTELDQVMMGVSTFKAGKVTFEGDRKPYEQIKGILVTFTPNFEILPGPRP